ncbi:MAG: flagellar hook-associated protein FlgL [Polyangiaceae bacterium]
MRVTDNLRFFNVQKNLSSLSSRQATVAQQAATGMRINAPSDDAAGASELVRIDSGLQRMDSYKRSIGSARDDASLAEATLGAASGLFDRARELALQGANGSLSANERSMLASEVKQLREQLTDFANAKGSRGYLFAGSRTDTAPFDNVGTFSGDQNAQRIEAGPGLTIQVSADGATAFTAAGGEDTFTALSNLEAALVANDPAATAASLGALDRSKQQLTSARASSGLLINRLDTADAAVDTGKLSLTEKRSHVGDADAFEAYSQLMNLSSSIEQAIAVAKNTLSLSSVSRF